MRPPEVACRAPLSDGRCRCCAPVCHQDFSEGSMSPQSFTCMARFGSLARRRDCIIKEAAIAQPAPDTQKVPYMLSRFSILPRLAAGLATALLIASPALSQDAESRLSRSVRNIEERLDARIGLVIRDSGSSWSWGHRAEERFLMNSTVKVPL